MSVRRFMPIMSFLLVFLTGASVWCQSVTLTGKTMVAGGSSLAGVSVSVYRVECPSGGHKESASVATTTSLADGSYTLSHIRGNSAVVVCYSLAEYEPNPSSVRLKTVPSGTQKVRDVLLVENSSSANYWSHFADWTKKAIDAKTADSKERTRLYQQVWAGLRNIGLSPQAEIEAARQLLQVAPPGPATQEIQAFASVKRTDLRSTVTNIREAAAGNANLIPTYSIPSGLAVDIAAQELKTIPSTVSTQQFDTSFKDIWGNAAATQLKMKMSQRVLNPQIMDQLMLIQKH